MGYIPNQIHFSTLKSSLKNTLICLASFGDSDGTNIYPARSTVANKLGVTERTVGRHLKQLKALGILELQGKTQRNTNCYRIRLERIPTNQQDISDAQQDNCNAIRNSQKDIFVDEGTENVLTITEWDVTTTTLDWCHEDTQKDILESQKDIFVDQKDIFTPNWESEGHFSDAECPTTYSNNNNIYSDIDIITTKVVGQKQNPQRQKDILYPSQVTSEAIEPKLIEIWERESFQDGLGYLLVLQQKFGAEMVEQALKQAVAQKKWKADATTGRYVWGMCNQWNQQGVIVTTYENDTNHEEVNWKSYTEGKWAAIIES